MKSQTGRLWPLSLLAAQIALLSLIPAIAFGCPAAHTDTEDFTDSPSLVPADTTEVTAVRVAGPFDTPWSVAFLPNSTPFS